MSRRRRGGGARLTTIYWRDIPAQVNGVAGDQKVQRILGERFHVAIDRAAMVADKADTDAYVAEWRQDATALDADAEGFDLEAAAIAAAEELEATIDSARMKLYVERGGWSPDRALTDDGEPVDPV